MKAKKEVIYEVVNIYPSKKAKKEDIEMFWQTMAKIGLAIKKQ